MSGYKRHENEKQVISHADLLTQTISSWLASSQTLSLQVKCLRHEKLSDLSKVTPPAGGRGEIKT